MNFKRFFEQSLITESKQEIMNLGYPPIMAKLFFKRFGRNAYLIAKWYRDYRTHDPTENWFNWVHDGLWANSRFRITLPDMIKLYQATDSPENYIKALEKLDLSIDNKEYYNDYYLQEQRQLLEKQIENKMFSETFFVYYSLINDVTSGKLRNVAPYKNLKFWEAQHKYDQKNIFQEKQPLKIYNNGFRWIDVGKKCTLVGHLMKNCGSAGVMSSDENRTMIALFDPENKPHVVVTYSPNQKRISGDEGVASTEVKVKYHRYILDLAQFLGANFDAKSKSLGIKYKLKDKATNIRKIKSGHFDQYFTFNVGPQVYYTDSHSVVSKQDLEKIKQALATKQINLINKQKSLIAMMFNYHNKEDLIRFGVNYIPINQFQST